MKHLAIVLLLLISCSPYQKYFKYDFEGVKAKEIKSVVITPIDMIQAIPAGSDIVQIRQLEEAINRYVGNNGFEVCDNRLLSENWDIESKRANGFFDPATGKIDGLKISGCLKRAVGRTKEKQTFDGLVFIQLIERPARLMGDRVYWDGCSRKLYDTKGDVLTEVTWRGEMNGLSLRVQLFNKDHQLVFQNIGAIEFPFALNDSYTDKKFVWKKQLEFHPEEVAEGIAIAFHPFIVDSGYPVQPLFYDQE